MNEATPQYTLAPAALPPGIHRRAVFTGSAALLAGVTGLLAVAKAAAGTRSPDAELLALCHEFGELERAGCASFSDIDLPEDEEEKREAFRDDLYEKQVVLVERILDIQPRTLAGFRAIAQSIVIWAPDMLDNSFEELGGLNGNLNAFLLRGLIGEARA